MSLMLITPPLVPVLSLEEAKRHLKVDGDAEDDVIETYIDTATRRLDGEAGLLGRCLIEQEWQFTLDSFPREIRLPLPPTISVDRITYVDRAGDHVTIDPERYHVSGLGTLAGATIRPRGSWPTPAGPDPVMIEFTAGFGSEPADVPEQLRQAIRELVAHFHEIREPAIVGAGAHAVPYGLEDLIADFRVREF